MMPATAALNRIHLASRFRFLIRSAVVAVALVVAMGATRATARQEIFVANEAADSITVYGINADGNVPPLRIIGGPDTELDDPEPVAVDPIHEEIFVGNTDSETVTVYRRTDNGNVEPLRTIEGALTGLSSPEGIALDLVNDELAVSNPATPSITVYRRTDDGNVAPLRTITGGSTGLEDPHGLAIDPVHNEIVVANGEGESVLVFSRTADGNQEPLRTLEGPLTGLVEPEDVAVDLAHDTIVVAETGSPDDGGGDDNTGSIITFARTAEDDAAPLRTITGPATGLSESAALDLSVESTNAAPALSWSAQLALVTLLLMLGVWSAMRRDSPRRGRRTA
jgi:DNA-binding beta-propeller fold protein YncE